eukprot:COSAG06_NODE_41548_length_390_cov_0.807560_1_plen_64_part_01
MIILPGQARDKHRESSEKGRFHAGTHKFHQFKHGDIMHHRTPPVRLAVQVKGKNASISRHFLTQ